MRFRGKSTIPLEERCSTRFERRTPGKRYVNARWQCPRRKLRGLPYCGYCEPWDKKRERLAAKATQTPHRGGTGDE